MYSGVRRGTTWTTGPTEVGPSRLRIANQDLRVRSVEGPGRSLPPWPGQREGEDYFFSAPATRVFTLRTDRGTVAWAVPEDQADSALQRLGVPRTTRRKDGRAGTRRLLRPGPPGSGHGRAIAPGSDIPSRWAVRL